MLLPTSYPVCVIALEHVSVDLIHVRKKAALVFYCFHAHFSKCKCHPSLCMCVHVLVHVYEQVCICHVHVFVCVYVCVMPVCVWVTKSLRVHVCVCVCVLHIGDKIFGEKRETENLTDWSFILNDKDFRQEPNLTICSWKGETEREREGEVWNYWRCCCEFKKCTEDAQTSQ